jgi:autotransporter adhesin
MRSHKLLLLTVIASALFVRSLEAQQTLSTSSNVLSITLPGTGTGTITLLNGQSLIVGDGSNNITTIANGAVEIGGNNAASGAYSACIGLGNMSSGNYSIAFGHINTASASSATAFGWSNLSSGFASSTVGEYNSATGNESVALGNGTLSTANQSVAFGNTTQATGNQSASFGSGTVASGAVSVALGSNTSANAYADLVIGRYNFGQNSTGGSPTLGSWVSTDPVFEIGNGTGTTTLADAFVVFKSGNTAAHGTIRCAAGGDLSMGSFTAGTAP